MSSKLNFRGKTVWITGAAEGLGLELLKQFHNQSAAKFLLIDFNQEALNSVTENLQLNCHNIYCDISQLDKLKQHLLKIPNDFLQPDIVINCAGIEVDGLVENLPIDELVKSMNVNYLAHHLVTQFALPSMKNKKSGAIVNISSGMGRLPVPERSAYCAAKAALDAFNYCLRLEALPHNIFVTHVSPGPMKTRIHEKIRQFGNSEFFFAPASHYDDPKVVAHRILHAVATRSRRVVNFKLTELVIFVRHFLPRFIEFLLLKKLTKQRSNETFISSRKPNV